MPAAVSYAPRRRARFTSAIMRCHPTILDLAVTPKVAFFSNRPGRLARVYPPASLERVARQASIHPATVTSESFAEQVPSLEDVDYIFATWGMPALSAVDIGRLPRLKAVFYGAGTVKYFAGPFLDAGVRVCSAWAANAVPVGEFAAAQIVLSNKQYFAAHRRMHRRQSVRDLALVGNYRVSVSLLGAGMVGREVIRRLAGYDLTILVFDPYLSNEDAKALGVEKVSLADAFARSQVVSNHLANVPETVGMITGELLRLIPGGGTFINTGRGATVREAEMIEVLSERPDLTALLDVTDPEPPAEGSPLYTLENVWLSPHIAGSLGDEVVRMGNLMIEEFERLLSGAPLRFEVSADQLATMA